MNTLQARDESLSRALPLLPLHVFAPTPVDRYWTAPPSNAKADHQQGYRQDQSANRNANEAKVRFEPGEIATE